jgi:cell division protein FtsL
VTKLNLILFAVLIATALGVVASQHKARKLYIELQGHQEMTRQYDVEWGQLQLEQSTWAMHARIEQVARTYLQMEVPEPARIQVVPPGEAH